MAGSAVILGRVMGEAGAFFGRQEMQRRASVRRSKLRAKLRRQAARLPVVERGPAPPLLASFRDLRPAAALLGVSHQTAARLARNGLIAWADSTGAPGFGPWVRLDLAALVAAITAAAAPAEIVAAYRDWLRVVLPDLQCRPADRKIVAGVLKSVTLAMDFDRPAAGWLCAAAGAMVRELLAGRRLDTRRCRGPVPDRSRRHNRPPTAAKREQLRRQAIAAAWASIDPPLDFP